MGVPVKLGAGGVEEIIELDLRADEFEALRKSADAVRELVEVLHSCEAVSYPWVPQHKEGKEAPRSEWRGASFRARL